MLGLSSVGQSRTQIMAFANKGGLAEQFVGQQLRAAQSPSQDPQLFYRQRTGGRQGEIDYVVQHGSHIIPIEVKAVASGGMKSLHQFLYDALTFQNLML
jgi:uncharacterized protein